MARVGQLPLSFSTTHLANTTRQMKHQLTSTTLQHDNKEEQIAGVSIGAQVAPTIAAIRATSALQALASSSSRFGTPIRLNGGRKPHDLDIDAKGRPLADGNGGRLHYFQSRNADS